MAWYLILFYNTMNLKIFILLLVIQMTTGVADWNICDVGSPTFDQPSYMGVNTRGILHINVFNVSQLYKNTDKELTSCRCTFRSIDQDIFDLQYLDEQVRPFSVDPSCRHHSSDGCEDNIRVLAYDWSGRVMEGKILNKATSWNARVQEHYIQFIDKLEIVYNRVLQNPVSVISLSLVILTNKRVSLSCSRETVARSLDPDSQLTPGSSDLTESNKPRSTGIGEIGHGQGGRDHGNTFKFIVILGCIIGAAITVIALVIAVRVVHNRKAKRERDFRSRMNPIYRSGGNRGRTPIQSNQPPTATNSAGNPSGPKERYVSLETMQDVKQQNGPAVIHDDFTVSFNRVNQRETEPSATRMSAEINPDNKTPGNPGIETSSTNGNDHAEYENIPADDGYQNIPSEDGYQNIVPENGYQPCPANVNIKDLPKDGSSYTNGHTHAAKNSNATVESFANGKSRTNEENRGLLEDTKDESSEKYYTLWAGNN